MPNTLVIVLQAMMRSRHSTLAMEYNSMRLGTLSIEPLVWDFWSEEAVR